MFRALKLVLLVFLLLLNALFCACSEGNKNAGTTEESEGLYAVRDLDIAGVTQKGPFVTGSTVSVLGIDCKTMILTGERFTGVVINDKGEFTVEEVNLKSSCAVLEVTGYYFNEVTGEKSNDPLTLRVLTDFQNREKANVNILTHMEYNRVKYLVSEKNMAFAMAKAQAENEVLAAFDIEGSVIEFEDMNIFEQGDDNAALLAVSVLMLGDENVAGLTERLDQFGADIEDNGAWNDAETKAAIADWARNAEASGEIQTIRMNVESWGGEASVSSFEKYVEQFDGTHNTVLNPEIAYDSIVDVRDGQVYKTVRINNQIWMAQNLNYVDSTKASLVENSWCYDDNLSNCETAGRLYAWTVAQDSVCPDGWHLPDTTEWNVLFDAVGGLDNAGIVLKSELGWDTVNGTNNYGFSVVAAGERYRSGSFDSEGIKAYIWSATENAVDENMAYAMYFGGDGLESSSNFFKDNGFSVRCIKD